MADKSGIEWTDATWNPTVGCSVVSPGCTNCYAMSMAARIEKMSAPRATAGDGRRSHYAGLTRDTKAGPVWTGTLRQAPEHIWLAPLRWKRPRRIFVNSMSDLFHESMPDAWIDEVFAVMAMAHWHTFQVLTKRSVRMREYLSAHDVRGRIIAAAQRLVADGRVRCIFFAFPWPLRHVWVGVSAEDQRRADERVPALRATPAAVRFVSAEPLLGPIDFTHWLHNSTCLEFDGPWRICSEPREVHLDWIIVGGESGPGARPMHPDWARSIRDQCAEAGVAFFMKQMSGVVKSRMPAIPEDLLIIEMPNAR